MLSLNLRNPCLFASHALCQAYRQPCTAGSAPAVAVLQRRSGPQTSRPSALHRLAASPLVCLLSSLPHISGRTSPCNRKVALTARPQPRDVAQPTTSQIPCASLPANSLLSSSKIPLMPVLPSAITSVAYPSAALAASPLLRSPSPPQHPARTASPRFSSLS